jgi:hypothetical protein
MIDSLETVRLYILIHGGVVLTNIHVPTVMIHTEYYMSKSVSHAVSTREPYLTSRATGPRGAIGRGLIRHVIQILTCYAHYIIILFLLEFINNS